MFEPPGKVGSVSVHRVLMPGGAESWTVVDAGGTPIPAAETYLAHLAALDRSPNTVRAYATTLKLWFQFLELIDVAWDRAGLNEVSRFVAWLRAPAANVVVLETGAGRRAPSSVNRHLAALFSFYDHHARAGVDLADSLTSWRRRGRGSYKPFLHHVTAGRPVPTRPVRLRVPRLIPRTLSGEQVAAIIGACEHRRDHFLLSLPGRDGDAHRPGAGLAPRRLCLPRVPGAHRSSLGQRQLLLEPHRPIPEISAFLEASHHGA